MRKFLIATNGITITLLVTYIVLDAVYAPTASLSSRPAITILVFALPSISAIIAAMIRTSRTVTGVALTINIAFFLVLLLLAAGAATGIGGAFGLLIVIFPVELLLGLNGFALISGFRSKWANPSLHTDALRQ